MINFGCQQVLIDKRVEIAPVLEYLCSESNDLYNCAVYYARQIWFKTGRILSGFDLSNELKTNRHFQAGYASSMQQTCMVAGEAFSSFKALKAKFLKGELDQKPKPPKYRKPGGLFTVSYPKKWLKLTEKGIRVPLGQQVKAWFGISEFFLPMPTNLDWETIKEIRFLPRNGCFYAEFVYSKTVESQALDLEKFLSIDHGVDNWLTCVTNVGTSFIVDGLRLKSLNQGYNKRVAQLMDGMPNGFWSGRLARLTERRNRQMRDAINKAARLIIDHALANSIGRIIFGWNQGQKQFANMGKITNQKFVQIPTGRLKERLAQLCLEYGIEFIETEESYSSKASFLDADFLPKYGEKPEEWKASGKRIQRGLYRTAEGLLINADCNGAANIARKVSKKLGLDLSGLSRGVLTAPLRIPLWI